MTDSSEAQDAPADTPEPQDPAEPRKRGFFRRHWLRLSLATLIIAPAMAFTIWAGIALSYSYSEGSRSGYVQKLSRKGWVCKTWEGELAMTTQPGVAPVIFRFSIRSDSVAAEVSRLSGLPVRLQYEEHRGVPTSCFGETDHFVVGVSRVGP